MDCQPGSTVAPYKTFTPALAAPFATLEADGPLPPATAGAPVAPAARVVSAKLKRTGSRAAVVIACPAGTATCRGRVALRSVAPVRIAGRTRKLVVSTGAAYSVPAGARRTARLTLGRAVQTLLRTRPTLRVRATLSPTTGRAVTRDLTLHR